MNSESLEFYKNIDMINGQVDIAVHSMKDVPTALPVGIVQAVRKSNNPRYINIRGMLIFLMN
jgi:hydroxymethylbilane synthase